MADFAWALEQLKSGKKVRRQIWPKISRPDLYMVIVQPVGFIRFLAYSGGGVSGELMVPVTDLVFDVLAEDWELAE